MNETMFDWDDLRLFLAVARHGGLAAASEATGKSPPTLGRRMVQLERATGADLFNRLPRGYELTPQGQTLLARVTALEAQVLPLTNSPHKHGKALVKISAGSWMTQVLCQNAAQILGADKETALRFIAADHVLDILRREAIIGIRNQRPDQIGLACRKVGRVRFAGYASASGLPWARVIANTPSARWLANTSDAADCIEVTTPRNALDLALAGVACALLPTFIGDAHPCLARTTPLIDDLEHDQWLVTHEEDRFVPAVRRVITRVADVLINLHREGRQPGT